MTRNNHKFSNEEVRDIAKRYVSTDDTFLEIAHDYNCSTSKISKAIKKAIIDGVIDTWTAERIKEKATFNSNTQIMKYGYPQTKKVSNSYDRVINEALEFQALQKERDKLFDEILELEYAIDTYHDTFSDACDFFSYDEISDMLWKKKKRLEEVFDALDSLKRFS